jgi:hypothetical protein
MRGNSMRKLKERHYKIINILEGFQNSYKQNAWQVWALFDDGQRVFCGVFQTKAKAHDYIKENEQ